MADVKKEKELAEKRKNDPPLELSSDHPVRKLISRFRKISDAKAMQTNTDPEKGSKSDMNGGERGGTEKSRSFARLINVSENSAPKTGGGSSKWGKMMNGSGPPDGEGKQNKPNNESKEDLRNGDLQKPQSKPGSKWGKMVGKNSEPTKEHEKEETQNNLRKTESVDSGIIRSNVKLDHINEETIEQSLVVRHETNNNQSVSAMSLAERHMLTSLHDIKLEMKEDMDILHQKMNRIDEQIAEILRMFSPSTSSCSSHENSQETDGGAEAETTEEEEAKPVVLIRDVDFIPKMNSEKSSLYIPRDHNVNSTQSNSTSYGVSPVSGNSSTGSGVQLANSGVSPNNIGQQSNTGGSYSSPTDTNEANLSYNSASRESADSNHLQPPTSDLVSNSSRTQSPNVADSKNPNIETDPSTAKDPNGTSKNVHMKNNQAKEGTQRSSTPINSNTTNIPGNNRNISPSPGVHRGVSPIGRNISSPNNDTKKINQGRPTSRDKAVIAQETGSSKPSSPLRHEGNQSNKEEFIGSGRDKEAIQRETSGSKLTSLPSSDINNSKYNGQTSSNKNNEPVSNEKKDSNSSSTNSQDRYPTTGVTRQPTTGQNTSRPLSGNKTSNPSSTASSGATSPSGSGQSTGSKEGAVSKADEYPLMLALGPAAGYSANPMGMSTTPRPISPKLSSRQVTSSLGPAASVSDVSVIDASSPRNVMSMAEDVLKMKTKSPRPAISPGLKYSSNIQKISKARIDGRPDTRRLAGGIKIPLDTDEAHIKDRDLDIL